MLLTLLLWCSRWHGDPFFLIKLTWGNQAVSTFLAYPWQGPSTANYFATEGPKEFNQWDCAGVPQPLTHCTNSGLVNASLLSNLVQLQIRGLMLPTGQCAMVKSGQLQNNPAFMKKIYEENTLCRLRNNMDKKKMLHTKVDTPF